jgi:hypothetical protein
MMLNVSCIITRTVIRQPRVQFQVGPCGIGGGQRDSGRFFFPLIASFNPTSSHPSRLYNQADGVGENPSVLCTRICVGHTCKSSVYSMYDCWYSVYVSTHKWCIKARHVSNWFVLAVVGNMLTFCSNTIQTRQCLCSRKIPSGGCEPAQNVMVYKYIRLYRIRDIVYNFASIK